MRTTVGDSVFFAYFFNRSTKQNILKYCQVINNEGLKALSEKTSHSLAAVLKQLMNRWCQKKHLELKNYIDDISSRRLEHLRQRRRHDLQLPGHPLGRGGRRGERQVG